MARRLRSRSRRSAPLRRPRRSAPQHVGQSHRRGSTLLIVMVLMGMLALLGVMFYTFAAQERTSAENYSEAAKADDYTLDVDAQMDFALEQLIVGANPKYKNSALWGGRHSLLPNMLGTDVHPFNGRGVRVVENPSLSDLDGDGNPDPLGIDLDNDGNPESGSHDLLNFNDSPAARSGAERPVLQFPAPDVDYTYPDINNVYLAYEGRDPVSNYRVFIPSFHRPQLLRDAGGQRLDWYTAPAMARRVMRAHPSHVYVAKPGQQLSGAPPSRYLNDTEASTLLGPTYKGFPFVPPDTQKPDASAGKDPEPSVWQNAPFPAADPQNPDRLPEFDVDNDGDGVYEGVWLDIDFPPQESPDGTLYVPMVSFTVKDADGLLNLNAHGNLARVWSSQVTLSSPFFFNNNDPFVSKSNLGLSASEINPAWGLNRLPATEGSYTADTFFGGAPTDWREIANRELAFLKLGRVTTSPSVDLTPGVWGEENLLLNAVNIATGQPNTSASYAFAYDTSVNPLAAPWPGPGQTKLDDNANLVGVWGGSSKGVAQPAFVHPLDFLGVGTRANTGAPKSALLVNSGTGAIWPQYNGYTISGLGSGGISLGYAGAATGMINSPSDTLFNDVQETVFDLTERRDVDNLFGPDEMRALHLSTSDYNSAVGGETRLTTLAPYSIAPSASSYGTRSGLKFREKFTTESWDRKNFSWVQDPNRSWEYSANADGDTNFEFPPKFGNIPEYSVYSTTTPYADPFRPLLRKLLEIEQGDRTGGRRQLRFSINHLLTDGTGNPEPYFDPSGIRPPNLQLDMRPLTPHPDPASLGAAPIPNFGKDSYPANGSFSGNVQLQEYWARRDRQLMARDIYVMLYTLGIRDTIDPRTANPVTDSPQPGDRQIFTANQLRQMAQFAVNLVDALDRDNVLTRFEYDLDLSDVAPSRGWDLDDNAYATTGEQDRAEAWGAERLDVTLSETVAVLTESGKTSDFTFTQWKDDAPQPTYFTYIELQNPGPYNVDFDRNAWQLQVVPNNVATNHVNTRVLTLLDGTVAAGQRFLIGSASTSVGGMYPSVMKVNPDPASMPVSDFDTDTFTWIAPSQGRLLDLDLQDGSKASWYQLKNGDDSNAPVNALLDPMSGHIMANQQVDIHLRRRAYPNRPAPAAGNAAQEADNPWVSVDTLSIDNVRSLDFNSGDMAAQIQSELTNKTKSRERREPFAGYTGEADYNPAGGSANAQSYLVNTLGARNSALAAPGNFTRWQHHFDRDFSSLAEVLQLPIRGGVNTVRAVGNGFTTPVVQIQNPPTSIGNAASQFLMPIDASGNSNRWHRVLELLEVPTRTHVSIPGFRNPLDYPRVPGKINLNTVRHPEVLAGLIDDPAIISLDLSTPSLPGVTDQAGDARGNYWANLLGTRDGRRSAGATPQPDPVTGLYLPGTANSTPFRSPSYSEPVSSGVALNSPVLRPWTGDASGSGSDPRMFFELGSATNHTEANSNPPGPGTVEPAIRDRITGKILNNTTTRSNVFIVFVSIKYFRAVDDNGAIRIGQALAELPGNVPDPDPEHRGFFIIDRSQAERGYDASTGRFNFKDFIVFRQVLQ